MVSLNFEGILDNPSRERKERFAEAAGKSNGNTSLATGALIASDFYLADTLERSLTVHANALNKSAEAAEKHARSLTRATWALVGATIILTVVTGIPSLFVWLLG